MASSRIYDIAFRLNGKLNSSYKNSFARAESIADKAVSRIKNTVLALGSMVISTAAIKDFVDTYKEYQQEMYNVAATSGIEIGSEAYETLNEAALSAGKATTKTASEAADALNYMALAGWSAEDSAKGLMPMLRLSEATVSDLATTSDLVTDSMSAMNIGIDDMTKYLDMATMANNRSNQTSLQMMEVFTKAGGAARSLSLDMYDLGTAAGILANNGKKGTEAGTALNSIFVRIAANSDAISAMKGLGVSMYDAQGNARGFRDVLEDINDAMEGFSADNRNSYLSKIAGTRYYSQFNYLLEAVKNGTYDELYDELTHSDGALDRAANIQNSSLSARLKLLQSAWDDFKINVVSKAEPILSEWISKIAGKLPDVTENTMVFFKKSGKYVGELWNKGKALFQWASKNRDTLYSVFAGIGGAIIGFKVVSGVAGVASGLMALASNPVLLGILAVGAAVGVLAANVVKANTEMKNASLEEHFGKLSLTAKEIEDIADAIFDQTGQWEEYANAVDTATQKYNEFISSQHTVDVLNYKVSLGIKLSEDDVESYKTGISNYIQNAQEYITQKGYAIKLGIELLYGEEGVKDSNVDTYFNNVNAEFTQLGNDLAKTVNTAFEDGILSENEANVIAEKMYNIKKRVNDYEKMESEAKFEEISLRYSGASLTSDSYEALLQELQENADSMNESARAAYIAAMMLADDQWERQQKDPSLHYFESEEDYNAKKDKYSSEYLASINENNAKVYEYASNTINDTYGDEVANGIANTRMRLEELYTVMDGTDAHAAATAMTELLNTDYTQFFNKGDVLAMKELYDPAALEKALDIAKQYKELNKEVPQELMTTISNLAQQGVMAGDPEATATFLFGEEFGLREAVGNRAADMSDALMTRTQKQLHENFPEVFESETANAATKAQNYLDSNPLSVKVKANVQWINDMMKNPITYRAATVSKTVNGKEVQGPALPGYASGTSYTPDSFIAGEEGAELITNSKGYRVYDALETGKMYDNAAKVWELINDSREQSRQLAVSRQISNESGSTSEYNFNFSMPSITISGNTDDNTKQQFMAMLEEYKNAVKREVMSQIKAEADRKRRISNE